MQGVCPTGWHVPSDAEDELTDYLVGTSDAGGKLKETGTTHWNSPNTSATNEPVLQPFRVATVATVGRSTALVTPVTGGVPLRAVPITPGTEHVLRSRNVYTDSTAIRSWGFLSVA